MKKNTLLNLAEFLGLSSLLFVFGAGCQNPRSPEQTVTTSPSIVVSDEVSTTPSALFLTKNITIDTPGLTIDISYPETGDKKVDEYIATYVSTSVRDFGVNFNQTRKDDPNATYDLGGAAEVVAYSPQLMNIVFTTESYTGGAHPNHTIETLVFNRETGKRLSLGDVFKPKSNYLSALSRKSREQFADLADQDFVVNGTTPDPEHFKNFVLLPEGLKIYFNEYQVAPYVFGSQEVIIPFSQLSTLLQPWVVGEARNEVVPVAQ